MIEFKVLNSLVTVFADRSVEGGELNKITMCQNQASHFQIAFKLKEEDEHSKDFHIRFSTALPLSLYYVNNVPVINTSGIDKQPPIGLYPDILIEKKVNPKLIDVYAPTRKITVEEEEYTRLRAYDDSWQSVYICINEFQKTLKSGVHKVRMEVFDKKSNLVGDIELTVEVLGLKLPKQKLLYTNWFHYDCISDIYSEKVFTDRYFDIIRDYIEKAVRNGMNMILLPAFTPPLDTGIGDERMTVQLVNVTKEGNKYSFDFSLMKRFIDFCKSCGITHFEHSHLFTQWGAQNAPKVIVTEKGKTKKMFGWKANSTGKAYVSFLNQYLESLKAFLKAEKLEKNIMFHISDEPRENHLEQYKKARDIVKKVFPKAAIGDAISHVEFYKMGYCDTPIAVTATINKFIGVCDNLWAYYTGESSLHGRSSRVLTLPRERNRMLGVQLYYYDIKGFLHWAYNNYYGEQSKYFFNPALNPSGGFALAGTSYVVYPDFNGKCMQSVRQKTFFEGLTDIRLLSLLEKNIGKEACHKLIEKHFSVPDFNRSADSAKTYIDFLDDVYATLKVYENE